MTTASPLSPTPPPSDGSPQSPGSWLWLFAGCLVLGLAGWWYALCTYYSSLNYHAAAGYADGVAEAWMGLAVAGAVLLAAWVRKGQGNLQTVARAALPLGCFGVVATAFGWSSGVVPLWGLLGLAGGAGWLTMAVAGSQPERSAGQDSGGSGALGILLTLIFVLGVYFFFQQNLYWRNLAYGFSDSGQFARQMYNSWHHPREAFMRAYLERPVFFDHFEPGVVVLLPLWYLWQDLRLVVILQIVATLGTALPLFWLGKRIFRDEWAALLLAVAWLVFPSTSLVIYDASYGFRWGSLFLLILPTALLCWHSGRWKTALGLAVWAALIKEEASIVIGMFGVYLLLTRRPRWHGLAILGGFWGYFLAVGSVIMPVLLGRGFIVQDRYYGHLGATKLEILLSPVMRPEAFWGSLISHSTFYLLAILLVPLLLIPLRKPRALLVATPILVAVSLWSTFLGKSIAYHYHAIALPVVFWALAEGAGERGAGFLGTRLPAPRAAMAGVCVACLGVSVLLGNAFWTRSGVERPEFPGRIQLVEQMRARIPQSASLKATERVAAHFINQDRLYLFHLAGSAAPPTTDFALIDLRQRWANADDRGEYKVLLTYQREIEEDPGLKLIAARDGMLLYGREGTPLDRRQAAIYRGRAPWMQNLQEVADGVYTLGYDKPVVEEIPGSGWKRVVVTAYFAVREPVSSQVVAESIIRLDPGTEIEVGFRSSCRRLGQDIWPTDRWQPGEVYTEHFVHLVPDYVNWQALTFEIVPVTLPAS